MPVISITGTRLGLTSTQRANITEFLGKAKLKGYTRLVHGDCIGVDVQVGRIAEQFGYEIEVWPSNLDSCCESSGTVVHRKGDDPLARNRSIVDSGDVLLAFPKKMMEELRSGTWHAIRYARRVKRKIVFFWPDGTVTKEQGEPRATNPDNRCSEPNSIFIFSRGV